MHDVVDRPSGHAVEVTPNVAAEYNGDKMHRRVWVRQRDRDTVRCRCKDTHPRGGNPYHFGAINDNASALGDKLVDCFGERRDIRLVDPRCRREHRNHYLVSPITVASRITEMP